MREVETVPDAGLVHLDPEIQAARIGSRHREQRIAVTDSDFESAAQKFIRQNKCLRAIVNTIYRPVALQCVLLRRRDTARATYKTADTAFIGAVGGHIVTRISSLRALYSAVFGAKYRLSVLFYILS